MVRYFDTAYMRFGTFSVSGFVFAVSPVQSLSGSSQECLSCFLTVAQGPI